MPDPQTADATPQPPAEPPVPEPRAPQTMHPEVATAQIEAQLLKDSYAECITDYWEPRVRKAELKALGIKQQLLAARADLAMEKRNASIAEAKANGVPDLKAADLQKRLDNLHGEHERIIGDVVETVGAVVAEMEAWREEMPHPFKSKLIQQTDLLAEYLKDLRPKPPPV